MHKSEGPPQVETKEEFNKEEFLAKYGYDENFPEKERGRDIRDNEGNLTSFGQLYKQDALVRAANKYFDIDMPEALVHVSFLDKERVGEGAYVDPNDEPATQQRYSYEQMKFHEKLLKLKEQLEQIPEDEKNKILEENKDIVDTFEDFDGINIFRAGVAPHLREARFDHQDKVNQNLNINVLEKDTAKENYPKELVALDGTEYSEDEKNIYIKYKNDKEPHNHDKYEWHNQFSKMNEVNAVIMWDWTEAADLLVLEKAAKEKGLI